VGPERLLVSALGRATWRRFLEPGGQYLEDLTLAPLPKTRGFPSLGEDAVQCSRSRSLSFIKVL
jgi:hypothetical protein